MEERVQWLDIGVKQTAWRRRDVSFFGLGLLVILVSGCTFTVSGALALPLLDAGGTSRTTFWLRCLLVVAAAHATLLHHALCWRLNLSITQQRLPTR
jgi:hypothetical protein